MKINSVRWQIILPTLLLLLAGYIAFYHILSNTVTQIQTQTIEDTLSAQIWQFSDTLENNWQDLSNPRDFQTLADEWSDQTNARISLVSNQGEVLAESSPTPPDDTHLYTTEIQQALTASKAIFTSIDQATSPPAFILTAPIQIDGNTQAVLRLIYPLYELETTTRTLRRNIGIGAAIIIAITLTTLVIQTSLHGRRLDKIEEAIHQISQGNRDVKIDPGIRDEVGNLAYEVNLLANNLQEEFRLMQNEQAKLNAVLTQMSDGVIILDNKGVIILANHTALNIFNFSDVSVEGLRLVRVIRNHHIVDLWEEFQETGEDQAALLELSESNKFVQTYLAPLSPNLPGYSLFYFQDLTKMRKLEKVRRDFVSNISHELRTPLASLKALADTIQVTMLDDPEASERFLKRMDTEIDALTQMVSELLELSKIESGQVQIEISPTDANKVLARACDRLIIQAEREKIKIKTNFQDSQSIIMVDETRIEQVLVNIIHNAIKFTPPDGTIECSVGLINDEVVFKIQDNGPGISAEDLPRIFERFYKSKRQNSGTGTGLGLSIAKHLTEANGGQIWAESNYGEGATFFISFRKSSV
jgi:two-component system phosphate regulon sensor histidine kinase PhoR